MFRERIVPRRSIALVDEQILAFEASDLRSFINKDGFKRGDDTHLRLLSSCFSVKRAEAELRFDIIQLISDLRRSILSRVPNIQAFEAASRRTPP